MVKKTQKPAGKADAAVSQPDLEARVSALEQHIVALTAPPKTVDVEFDLDKSTTAHLARCYLKGTTKPADDLANNMGKPHSVLKDQKVGATIAVVVQASDTSPSAVAAFNVTNCEESRVTGTADDQITTYKLVVSA
jgi:hypothetical protein